jgi:hypothetical protein
VPLKRWVDRHKPRTVLCFVQFKRAKLTELPRLYLATPAEVGDRLRASRKDGRDNSVGAARMGQESTWRGNYRRDTPPVEVFMSKNRVSLKRPLTDDSDGCKKLGSIATDFEQFMPRGWSVAARGIVGEGGHRQVRPRFFNGSDYAPLRLYFVSARK